MARFRFTGHDPHVRGAGVRIGKVLEIRVPQTDGTLLVFRPRNGAQGFLRNEALEGGALHRRHPDRRMEALEAFDETRPGRGRVERDITDERALRYLRHDPRFAEII